MSFMNLVVEDDVDKTEQIIAKYLRDRGIIAKFWIALSRHNPKLGEWYVNYSFKKDEPTFWQEDRNDFFRSKPIPSRGKVCGVIRKITGEYNSWIQKREAKREFNSIVRSALIGRKFLSDVRVFRTNMWFEWDEKVDKGKQPEFHPLRHDSYDINYFTVQARFDYEQHWEIFSKPILLENLSIGVAVRVIDDAYLKWALEVGIPEDKLVQGW